MQDILKIFCGVLILFQNVLAVEFLLKENIVYKVNII